MKNSIKRITALLLSVAMLWTLHAIVYASPEPTITVSQQTGTIGESVDVTISMEGNPGIINLLAYLNYDSNVLTLTNVTDNGIICNPNNSPSYTANPYKLAWEDDTSTENYTGNGLLTTLTFKVADNAQAGTYPITLTINEGDSYNVDMNDVHFNSVSGSITLSGGIATCAHSSTTQVNAQPSTCIAQGWDAYYKCDDCDQLLDVNGNEIDVVPYRELAPHSYGEPVISNNVAATCTTGGSYDSTKKCTVCENTVTDHVTVEALGHDMTKTDAVEATCTEPGSKEYYTCSRCHLIFSDAAGKKETTEDKLVINALDHDLKKVAAKAADCNSAGNSVYYKCSRCDALFEDKDGTIPTTIEAVTIAKLDHDLNFVAAKTASCSEKGNKAYYKCSKCNGLFEDPLGQIPTTAEDVDIKALDHNLRFLGETKLAGKHNKGELSFECTVCHEIVKEETSVINDMIDYDGDDVAVFYGDLEEATPAFSAIEDAVDKIVKQNSEAKAAVDDDAAFYCRAYLRKYIVKGEDESKKNLDGTAKDNHWTAGAYYCIWIEVSFVKGTGCEVIAGPYTITELGYPITITLDIPEELQGHDEYWMIREHQEMEEGWDYRPLQCELSADGKQVIFETDRFSDYALAYRDDYKIIEGAEQKVTAGNAATFKSNADYSDFISVSVDGAELAKNNYTVAPGSTIVTLSSEYVKTLKEGIHNITISSVGGNAITWFTIVSPEDTTPAEKTEDTSSKPADKTSAPESEVKEAEKAANTDTADTNSYAVWFVMIIAAAVGFVSVRIYDKKEYMA